MNIKNITKIDFYNLYINYTFDIFSYEKWVDNLYHKSDHYKTPILIEPNNNINLNNLNYLTIRKIKYFYTVLSDSRIINTYFNPKTVQIHYASDNSIKFFIFSKIQTELSHLIPSKKPINNTVL
ncbi:MAG: hypothetical protein C0627_03300 [Sulfurimonas sp.]|nr:MAG: hypothetical protein C0627_03300 [Sulfurimonas sp.]